MRKNKKIRVIFRVSSDKAKAVSRVKRGLLVTFAIDDTIKGY